MVRKSTPDKFIINKISPQFAGLRYWFAAQQPDGDNVYELIREDHVLWADDDPSDGWIIDGERGGFVLNHTTGFQDHFYKSASANPPDVDNETDISISAWVKLNDVAGIFTYFTKNSLGASPTSIELKWHASNGWSVVFSESGTTSEGHTGTSGFAANIWYHIVVVYNGNGSTDADKVKIYIDGIDQGLTFSGTLPTAIPATAGKIYIGTTFNASDEPIEHWEGTTDDIRIYGIILSPGNVAHMHAPSTRWELYRGPEVGFIGLAVGDGQTFNEIGESGILVGGEPDETIAFDPLTEGGTLVGGEPDETIAFDPLTEGGTLVGGIATVSVDEGSNTFNEVGEGGILVGGEPAETMIFNPSIESGILVGGEPTETMVINETVAGGMLVDGEITVDSAEAKLPTGGILVGGEPAKTMIFNPPVAGGTLAGGEALESEEQTEPVEGGVLVGGIALESKEQTEPVEGGVLVGGEITVDSAEAKLPDGGILVGGEGIEEISLLGTGGILVGGEPTEVFVYNISVESGTLVGGEATVASAESFIPAGGIFVGGEGVETIGLFGKGGMLVGGLTDINSAEAFVPVGGTLVSGEASVLKIINIILPTKILPIVIPSRGATPTVKPHTELNENSIQFKKLKHAWPMLHPGGEELYDLARGQDGVLTNMDDVALNWIIDGERGGYVLNLDGTDDFVNLGDLKQLKEATVSLWFNSDTVTNNERIYAQLSGATGQGGSLRFFNSGIQTWDGGTWETIIPAGIVTAGQWHHLVVVYDIAGNATGFLDGQQHSTSTTTFDFDGVNFGLGANFILTHGTTFSGSFDDVRLYDRTLVLSEVIHLYNPQTRWELYTEPERAIVDVAVFANIGVVCGGEATLSGAEEFIPEGGILVGGEVLEEITENVDGGVVVDGIILETMAFDPFTEGGAIVGGITNVTSVEARIPSEGAIVGGVALEEFVLVVGGGVKVGGTVEPPETVSGGVILGGQSNTTFVEVGVSGAIVGGEITVQKITEESVSGGAIVGGINVGIKEFVVKGGAIVGGIAQESEEQIESVSGGTLISGTAEVGRVLSEETSGGIVLGGFAPNGFSEIGRGGAVVGGDINESVSVTHDFTYRGDGIIIIDGSAGTRRLIRTPQQDGPYVIALTTGDSCIDCCQSTRDDCPHWSEHWQDKWEGPYDAIKESVDEVEEIAGLWENQWQSALEATGEAVNA